MSESVYDVLRTFHLVKNVQEGMTQEDWVALVNHLEAAFKRGKNNGK